MLAIPETIAPLLKRPVGVFGKGVTGKAVVDLLKVMGAAYVVYDEKCLECSVFDSIAAKQHNLVIYSPGFSQEHPWLKLARENGCTCLAEMDFAAVFWQGEIIAVTGTNGKTTLTEFMAQALCQLGKKAIAVGNNGSPLSGFWRNFEDKAAVAVCETSSFQSEDLKYLQPDDVLWTNFDEDHMDRHQTMEKYFNAKWNLIERLQDGIAIIGESVYQWAKKMNKTMPANLYIAEDQSHMPTGTIFEKYPQSENFAIARKYWVEKDYALAILLEAASAFKLPKHRLQKVAKIGEVSFWNDSKATNFHATQAALRGFEKPIIWIGGGAGKGLDTKKLIDAIYDKIAMAFLIGDEAEKLQKNIEEKGGISVICKTLEEVVKCAYAYSEKYKGSETDIVFSPGFTSYDMFDNYAHRGNCYEEIVLRLKHESKANIPK